MKRIGLTLLILLTAFAVAWLTPPSLAVENSQISHAAD